VVELRRSLVRVRRVALASLLIAFAVACALLVPSIRTGALSSVGAVLVAEDALAPVDIIVVGLDAPEAGALEAADLVRQGITTRVAVLAGPVSIVGQEFSRRGVAYEDPPTQSVRLLRDLGVEGAELLRLSVNGTEEAGQLLPEWCTQQKIQSLMIVTGADHSRRVRRVLRRNMRGASTQVIVRFSRYSPFTPDRWWLQRGTLRSGIVELQKLLLDMALHPVS
jgi:hypothetical protein